MVQIAADDGCRGGKRNGISHQYVFETGVDRGVDQVPVVGPLVRDDEETGTRWCYSPSIARRNPIRMRLQPLETGITSSGQIVDNHGKGQSAVRPNCGTKIDFPTKINNTRYSVFRQ